MDPHEQIPRDGASCRLLHFHRQQCRRQPHPVGDPPLFLGFLRGIPFGGHAACMDRVAAGARAAAGSFYVVDLRNFHRAPPKLQEQYLHEHEHWMFRGLPNLFWLAVVLGSVFIPRHWRIGGDSFAIPVSALTMAAAAFLSWKTTRIPCARRMTSPSVR